jgi:hypothetical protein
MLHITTECYKTANLPLANGAPKVAALLVIDIDFIRSLDGKEKAQPNALQLPVFGHCCPIFSLI